MIRRLAELSAALVLRRMLGRPGRRGAAPERGPVQSAPTAAPPPPTTRPRGPLVVLMLGSFGLGLVLMFFFEAWYTRLVGVLALFTFIVTGVFVLAAPPLLDVEEDN